MKNENSNEILVTSFSIVKNIVLYNEYFSERPYAIGKLKDKNPSEGIISYLKHVGCSLYNLNCVCIAYIWGYYIS